MKVATLTTELRVNAKLFSSRTLVRTFGLLGDPTAKVLARHPLADPFPQFERIRAKGPVSRHPLGVYLCASHAVAREILRDGRFRVGPAADNVGVDWRIGPVGDAELVHPTEDSLLTMNPPRHGLLRKHLAPWFTPQAMRVRSAEIDKAVSEVLDGLDGRREFDLVQDFALRVPMRVICDFFGLPDDQWRRFAGWGTVLSGTLDGLRTMAERRDVHAVAAEMTAFFDELIARRRAEPGDDLVSRLMAVEPDGEPLGRTDLVALAGMLLIGGFETATNAIASGVVDLLRDPGQRRLVEDDPSRGAELVEEVLRFETPAQYAIRFSQEPVEIAGVKIPAESPVVLFLAGANRDPEVFADAQRFDLTRPNNRDHLAFSAGSHYCLGAALARAEIDGALRGFFDRFPDAELNGPVRLRRSRNIRGPVSVPMRRGTAGVGSR
jgi:cytochrome P450